MPVWNLVLFGTIRSAFVFEFLLPRRLFGVSLIGLIGLTRWTFICFFHYRPEMGGYFEVSGLVTEAYRFPPIEFEYFSVIEQVARVDWS